MKNRLRRLAQPRLPWRNFSLQLFLFAILPLTLLSIAVAFGSQSLHHDSMRVLVGDRDLRAVRAAANNLARELDHIRQVIQLAAAQPDAAGLPGSQLNIDLIQSTIPAFDRGMALLSPSGELLAGEIPGISDLTACLPAPGPGAAFSNLVQAADGELVILVAAGTPGGGRLIGGFLPAALAQRALADVSTPQTNILLVSAGGELLYQSGYHHITPPLAAYPGVSQVLRGESGVNYGSSDGLHLDAHDAGEQVVAYSPVAELGWGLILEESWSDIASPQLITTQNAPLVLIPVLLLATVALWFGARQIVGPLQALQKRSALLASGDFRAIQQPVGGITEIRLLQQALVATARALENAQDALRGYIGSLTAGVENERRALARELHDDTLQALIALNQRVQMAQRRAQDAPQRSALAELQEKVAETITNLRRTISGLRPIYLEDLGLVAALGMLAAETTRASALPCELILQGSERRLPPDAEMAFYRIAQEAVANAVHHARAAQTVIHLDYRERQLVMTISDDGAGFQAPEDPSAFARQGHYGLLGMRERADLIEAIFELKSTPAQGTSVQITWPG